MRILLVAHEFPPIPSPQSLRWAYLVRELCRRGHEVSVLTVDSPADFTGLPPIPPSVRVYRAIGGPVQLLAAMLIRRQVRRKGGNTGSSADAPVGVGGAQ